MSSDSKSMLFLIIFISFLSIFFANLLYSPIHKYLRNNKIYTSLMIFAVLMLIVSVYQVETKWEIYQKQNALTPLLLVTYLISYKIADSIILKKYKRHMYFSCRISSSLLKNEEAENPTWLEIFLQFSLLIISILVWWIFGKLIAEKFL